MRAYSAGDDAFVARLDGSGSLVWNTFLGAGVDDEGFGSCTNHGACQKACPKEISVDFIARLNRARDGTMVLPSEYLEVVAVRA